MSDVQIPHKSSLLHHLIPVLLLLFVGYVGFSLAVPIFPAIILDKSFGFIPADLSIQMRTLYLGCLIAVYPLGQAIGSPILGKASDKYGRKRILLVTLLAIVPAHLMTGYMIAKSNLLWLVFFRFVCGLLEGNIVIAQAVIADVSANNQERAQNFGWVTAVVSGSFIFGPLLGGILSDNRYVDWFTYATPFYAAAVLAFISFLFIALFFRETKEANPNVEISFLPILRSIRSELQTIERAPAYFHNFLIYVGQFFFWSYMSVFLIYRYDFNIIQLALANGYSSIPMIIAPFFFRKIASRVATEKTLIVASVFCSLSFILFMIPDSPYSLFFTLLPIGFFIAMQYSFAAMLISERSSLESQGHNLGINQSGLVIAEALSGVVGGVLAAFSYYYPIIAASIFPLLGAIYLATRKQR